MVARIAAHSPQRSSWHDCGGRGQVAGGGGQQRPSPASWPVKVRAARGRFPAARGGGQVAVVVGGGDSVGQAALSSSRSCSQVHVIIRANSLTRRCRVLPGGPDRTGAPHHRLRHTQVTAVIGTDHLEGGADPPRGPGRGVRTWPYRGLFVFIGAKPRTEWLAGHSPRTATGSCAGRRFPRSPTRPREQVTVLLETSRPGIFAVGDVAAGGVQARAAAMGKAPWLYGSCSNACSQPEPGRPAQGSSRPAPRPRKVTYWGDVAGLVIYSVCNNPGGA